MWQQEVGGVPKSVGLNGEQLRAGRLNNSTKELCDEKITKQTQGISVTAARVTENSSFSASKTLIVRLSLISQLNGSIHGAFRSLKSSLIRI
jgi:hypothetical protein